jgi:hypothetical protein
MPDNVAGGSSLPQSSSPGAIGTENSSGHLTLPSGRKSPNGRIVVKLSSVAKTPPPVALESSSVTAPPKQLPALSSSTSRGGILPAKETAASQRRVLPGTSNLPQLNRTVEVKLPPKSGVLPKLTSLASMPVTPAGLKPPPVIPPITPVGRSTPPPLPVKRLTSVAEAERIAAERFPSAPSQSDSSMSKETAPPERPPGWKHLQPGELPQASPQSPEVFNRSQASEKEKGQARPPLNPPPQLGTPVLLPGSGPIEGKGLVRPPPLPTSKSAVLLAPPHETKPAPALVVPPLANNVPPPPVEKLRLPPVLHETPRDKTQGVARTDTPPPLPLIQENKTPVAPLHASVLPAHAREAEKHVLPSKIDKKPMFPQPSVSAAPAAAAVPSPAPAGLSGSKSADKPPLPTSRSKTYASPAKAAPTGASSVPPEAGAEAKTLSPRTVRSRKRKLVGTIVFYLILLPLVSALLFFLGVHFSSETRVEGQVIPPSGMLLSNEVWIVSDFRELASGIADDLAAERAPKLQEIQERQDHVQRAQADIAAREERIRLLQ